jgi:hypothetical protein
MLISGSQLYINHKKKMETFPIYFDWSITHVAKLFGQPSQNGEKYSDKDNACDKHMATSQLLTNSDPHIESPCPVQTKFCNTHSHSPLPALLFSPSSSSTTSSSLCMLADCSVLWNFLFSEKKWKICWLFFHFYPVIRRCETDVGWHYKVCFLECSSCTVRILKTLFVSICWF